MKNYLTLLIFMNFSFLFSQENYLDMNYVNVRNLKKCYYYSDNGAFNGILKIKLKNNNYQLAQLKNACNYTVVETFNEDNELIFRDEYVYDDNNEIKIYKNDSVNLGKSKLLDSPITNEKNLQKKTILSFSHADFQDSKVRVLLNGKVFIENNPNTPYSIFYKDGIPIYIETYYIEPSKKINELLKKEYFEILVNKNGAIYDSKKIDKKFGFILKGKYLKWNKNGAVLIQKNID